MGFLKNLLGLGVAAGTAYAAVKVAQKYNEKKKAEPDQNGDGTVNVNDTVYGVKDAAREVYEETAAKVREKAPEVREKAAAAAAAVQEQGIIAFGGGIGHRPCGGVRQAVAAAHHEGLEGIFLFRGACRRASR